MNDTRDDSNEFSLERQRRAAPNIDKKGEDSGSRAAADKSSSTEPLDNALPDRIRRRYYVVASKSEKDGSARERRLYADERKEYLAFKTTDDRLVTRIAAVEVIRDMVSVAQHRQWEALHVRGSVEFRREAWLEAGARGMEVHGYQANELDRQALADRRDVWDRAHARRQDVEARPASERNNRADQLDYDKGVSGRLIEVGRAPYRNHNDAESSTHVTIVPDNGRQQQLWGVGLEKATVDSKARTGDRIEVRRDGVERVAKDIKVIDAASGSARIERRQVPRNLWRVTAEKFRTVDRQTAACDPDLIAAHSQIVIIKKTLERAFPGNERARRSIIEAAKERIAQHLEHGIRSRERQF